MAARKEASDLALHWVPLALTSSTTRTAHSDFEERCFTLGLASDGKLLAVAHTYSVTGPNNARARTAVNNSPHPHRR